MARLTDAQIQQFTAWLDAGVRNTKEAIARLEEQFGMDYPESDMLKLLKRLDTTTRNQHRCLPKPTEMHKRRGWRATSKKRALKGHGKVYFVDAAYLLHNAVPGHGWIKRGTTVELKINSGRNRLNVFGAYSPDDDTLVSKVRSQWLRIRLLFLPPYSPN
jgi:hypothetical protein